MMYLWFRKPKAITFIPLLLSLAFIIACGTTATPTTAPQATTAVQPTAALPVAVPAATAEPATLTQAVGKPQGTLNIGFKELGPFRSHPGLVGAPQLIYLELSAFESPVANDPQGGFEGLLAREWSFSPDGLVWTFNLEEGVPFHKGYGEMTAEDFIWSLQAHGRDDSLNGMAGDLKSLWLNEEGWVKAVDDYTVQVNTGTPRFDVLNTIRYPMPAGGFIFSKKQSAELGEEEASRNGAGTGPFEIVEHRTGEFWRFEAVEDHWRKTPNFAELIFWEIPEESTRVANFQTGKLDTMSMAFDSQPAIEKVPGTKFLRQDQGVDITMRIYGNWYGEVKRPGYQPDRQPWVSSNPDTSSPEWEQARKVRLALMISIDRELIIKELLRGEGKPGTILGAMGHEDRLLTPDMRWDFNPERARQLLAEAGYPDGFELTLTPAIRNAPAEVEITEAIATMWEEIGVRAKLQKVPYSTIRPSLISRTYEGITVHGTLPFTEPVMFWNIVFNTEARFSAGLEHPWLDEMILKARSTMDREERWKLQQEMARWLFDNVLAASVVNVNVLWPLSTKLDVWTLRRADPRYPSNLEYAPHR